MSMVLDALQKGVTMHSELISTRHAATIMGLTYEALHKRLVRGTLQIEPVAMIGGQYLWRKTDAARYAA
jgi:hypothetical protein